MMRLAFTMMLFALTACGGEVRYVEATPAPEVTASSLEGDSE